MGKSDFIKRMEKFEPFIMGCECEPIHHGLNALKIDVSFPAPIFEFEEKDGKMIVKRID